MGSGLAETLGRPLQHAGAGGAAPARLAALRVAKQPTSPSPPAALRASYSSPAVVATAALPGAAPDAKEEQEEDLAVAVGTPVSERQLQARPNITADRSGRRCISWRGDPDVIVVETQADVERLSRQNCTQVGHLQVQYAELVIRGNFTNLSALSGLRRVYGTLTFWATQLQTLDDFAGLEMVAALRVVSNPRLTSLSAMTAAVFLELHVRTNPALISLAGPRLQQGIESVRINANLALPSLEGMQSLKEVTDSLQIRNNLVLQDLQGLRGLRFVAGTLIIEGNPALSSLAGLESLLGVSGVLRVDSNAAMTSLQGLHRLGLAGTIAVANCPALRVLGGMFSDSIAKFVVVSVLMDRLPRCVTPQEWTSITGELLRPQRSLQSASWDKWTRNGCGPDRLVCWRGLPCIVDLALSSFRGEVSLPAMGRTCGPCRRWMTTARVGANGTVDVTELLKNQQPGEHSLCQCLGGPVGAGPVAQISLLGPRSDHDVICSRGSECAFAINGSGLSAGAEVKIVARACGHSQAGIRAVGGSDGMFRPVPPDALAAEFPGVRRLCWRPPCVAGSSACADQDIGKMEVSGPYDREVGSVIVGEELKVANLGAGVQASDMMRLLRQCGTFGTVGLVSESGPNFFFSFHLDPQSVAVGTYRKCWCDGAALPCNESGHFLVDSGSVKIICPAGQEPTDAGECRDCAAGTTKGRAGNDACRVDPVYVSLLAVFSLLVFFAFYLMLVTFRSPIRVEDVSTIGGRTYITTWGSHGLHMYGRAAFAVHFCGTAHPGLDAPTEAFKAHRYSPTGLELLTESLQTVSQRLDTSRGFISLTPREEIWHRGWPAPLVVSVPSLVIAATVLHALQRQSLAHGALGVGVAFLAACAARLASRVCRRRSPLERCIEAYRQVLLERNPSPEPCEKGPQRAIEIGELLDLLEFFQSVIRDRTAYYMDGNIFGPLTKPKQLSYAELVGPRGVEWFVSHYWGNSFVHFCEAVQKHAENCCPLAWRSMAYWICFCSNNQYQIKDELGSSWRESSFFLALRSGMCKGVCMVLDDTAMPLTRSWCIFELLQTLQLERDEDQFSGLLLCTSGGVLNYGQGSVEVAMNLARRIATLDLAGAGASCEGDKEMINEQVVKELGSFGAMNKLVRKKMRVLLEKAQANANQSFESSFELLDSSERAAREFKGWKRAKTTFIVENAVHELI